jgi:hypothetical protein
LWHLLGAKWAPDPEQRSPKHAIVCTNPSLPKPPASCISWLAWVCQLLIAVLPHQQPHGLRHEVDVAGLHRAQLVEVGPNYVGLAFKSDNQAFDGASREVWFVFRGNLYQISTYAWLDPLLQAIFKTWQFQ